MILKYSTGDTRWFRADLLVKVRDWATCDTLQKVDRMSNDQVKEFLNTATTNDIPFSGNVLKLSSSTPPMDGFRTIVERGVLSAPVYEEKNPDSFVGFLDTRNLTSWVLFAYNKENTSPSLDDIVGHGVKICERAIDNVTSSYLARPHPFRKVNAGDPLIDICRYLANRSHRVAVVDPATNAITKIVSQSTLVKYMYDHRAKFPEFMSQTVVNLGSAPVISVPMNTSTIDVFRCMDKYNLSGIAILNPSGGIIGCTTSADLKLFLQYKNKACLEDPILDFLNEVRQQSLRSIVPVLSCKASSTMEHILGKLTATRMHRIFLLDDNGVPLRVISLSDILKMAFN